MRRLPWKEHLRRLDDLKQSVQNATYEQKDPLLMYKLDSFDLFRDMLITFNRRAIAILLRGQLNMQVGQEVNRAGAQQRTDMSRYRTRKDDMERSSAAQQAAAGRDTREQQRTEPIRRTEPKVGRNDPCPCGSGKKYKNCHGKGL